MDVGVGGGDVLVGSLAGGAATMAGGVLALVGRCAALVMLALVDEEEVKALVAAASGASIAFVLARVLGIAIDGGGGHVGDAIADKLDCVVASEASALVSGVDTAGVVEEVVVHGESDGDGAVGDELGLEGVLADEVAPVAVLVLGEFVGRIGAGSSARGHGTIARKVGLASQCDDARADKVVSGVGGPAAAAAHVVGGVAAHEVLGRHIEVDGTLGGDGKAVGKCLGGAKSPATLQKGGGDEDMMRSSEMK